jgi:RNA polymerase sigma-70 factor (ECF subfamily)
VHADGTASSVGSDAVSRFSREIVPHIDAAYILARWLVRNDQDAEDVVQEALLRAFRFLDGFRGENPRAWIISIVRNTCYSWLEANRTIKSIPVDTFDGESYRRDTAGALVTVENPESLLLKGAEQRLLNDAIAALPIEYREIIVLRELEGLSYKEISEIAKLPIGTVMSRLSRGRRRLRQALQGEVAQGTDCVEIEG